jgi:Transglycosylase/AsmA family
MKINNQKIVRILLILAVLLVIIIIALFFFRENLLQQAIVKVEHKFKSEYNCDFKIKEAKFEGLSGLSVNEITLVPTNADTLLSIQKIKTKVNLFELITGDVVIENLELSKGFIQLVKNKNGRNFDAFLKSKSDEAETDHEKDYAELLNKIITTGLNLVPAQMTIKDVALRIDDMGKKVSFQTDQLVLKDKILITAINVSTPSFFQKWNISGLADPRHKKADLSITSNDSTHIQIPYIKEKFNLISSFDNLHFKVDKIDMDGGQLHIDGFTSVDNFTLNNPRIATKDVVFDKTSFNFKLLVGSDFISLTDKSELVVNSIKMNPYVEYNNETNKVYTLKLKIPKMTAQDFITSLPKGLFSHFEGMQANGAFDYSLVFKYNEKKPWQIVLDSKFNKYGLQISKYGKANLNKLNSEFVYTAIDNGMAQRPVLVGLENQFYTPLNDISPYLKKAVLTCEDPSFMSHRGFINEAFKQSIAKNIRTKKFSRGASTISMQLVKNVFLTREKTLSRKLEEILLVYILENNRIASKERMLEVYFNVIEWGPNVYGIGEAASFYFQKRPINLTLKECLFLASIVPKPKKFMYEFDDQGQQKSFAEKHQDFIAKIMLRRGLLTPEDTIGSKVPISITGAARSHMRFKVRDSVVVDTLNYLGDM